MILALNTAQAVHELALLDEGRLLSERRWENAKEDVEKLVPTLQDMLRECARKKSEITDVVVVCGPGSFTSVRVGVAFINALAEGLRAAGQTVTLHSLNTFELLALKAAITDPLAVVLNAGGLDIGLKIFNDATHAERIVGPMAPVLAALSHDHSLHIAAELLETGWDELKSIAHEKNWTLLAAHELQTLGQALQSNGLLGLTRHADDEWATPQYLKGANITVSSDPWKNARI